MLMIMIITKIDQ